MLQELDEAKLTALLASSEESSPRSPSPFTGLLLSMDYHPLEVLELVDKLWPFRCQPKPGPGRPQLDPLPLVCYLLPVCEPKYGSAFDLRKSYRRLKRDEEFRIQCGYGDRFPSESVFRKVASVLVENWSSFQKCLFSSEDLDRVLNRIHSEVVCDIKEPSLELATPFFAELQEMGWNGNIPPLYQVGPDRVMVSAVSPLVDRSGAMVCKSDSGDDSLEADLGVSAVSQGDVPKPTKRRYPRDWNAYNFAQTHEGTDVKSLLGGLSDLVNLFERQFLELDPRGRGRPRCQLGHAMFAAVLKAYVGLSSRRLHSSLVEAAGRGYLRDVPVRVSSCGSGIASLQSAEMAGIPKFNTVGDILRAVWLTPLLLELVSVVAGPLREVDTVFAVDGTGLSTRIYERWVDVRPANKPPDENEEEAGADASNGVQDGDEVWHRGWVKLHIVTGVKTNAIVRAAISPGSEHDNSYYRGLVSEAASRFDLREVSADKAYSSRNNHTLAEELGFRPLIPFKENTVPPSDDGSAWSKSLSYFLEFPDDFWLAYHKRSNVESTYSAFKRLFPEQLRTKGFNAQVNESLCKVIAYNLVVLAREVRMKGIDFDLPMEAMALEGCIKEVVEMRKPEPKFLGLVA